MNLLWIRPIAGESTCSPDERRIRDYVDAPGGISESAASLAGKLGISRRHCRRVLEGLVEQGVLRRHDFADIEPVYVRFPTL